MKRCRKCDRDLPLSDFYRHPSMSDGYLNSCKECVKARVAANYRAKRSQYAEYERKRFKIPERKRKILEYQRRRRQRYPEKYKARTAVRNALRDGRLTKTPCADCGAEKVEAHHEDYSKPLNVAWLCRRCHLARHGKVHTP